MASSGELSEADKQRYDRQIRVWGAEAQSRIQNSRVLVSGLKGLNPEVVKNIVLAGVNVVIQDHSVVSVEDLASNFFLSPDDVGKQTGAAVHDRIQQLNTYAVVTVETRPISELDDDFFKSFSVVLLSDCTQAEAIRVNSLCRQNSEKQSVFFWSGTFGLEAWFVADFGREFQYTDDPPNNKNIKNIDFPSLDVVLGKRWVELPSKFFPLSLTFVKSRILTKFRDAHGRYPSSEDVTALSSLASKELVDNGFEAADDLLAQLNIDNLASVAGGGANAMISSVLGSYLAQEVIKAVSRSGAPGFNVFVFDGSDYSVKAFPVK